MSGGLKWIVASALALSACATGLPPGTWARAEQLRPRPMTPPSPPRSIPDEAPEEMRAATEGLEPAASTPGPRGEDGRTRVVSLARNLVGDSRIVLGGRTYPNDCAGLVVGLYDQVGVSLLEDSGRRDNAVSAIYRYASSRGKIFKGGRPLPGDLVFYRETYDVNRDGRLNDGLTHIGVVETIAEDGTVSVIHRTKRGIVRYRMNLNHPNASTNASTGAVWNDALRPAGSGARSVLTGQLFAAYATLLP